MGRLTITDDGRISGYIGGGTMRVTRLTDAGEPAGDSHYFDAARFAMMAKGAQSVAGSMRVMGSAAAKLSITLNMAAPIHPRLYKVLTGYRGSSKVTCMTMTDEITSHTCRGCGEEFSTTREAAIGGHDCPTPPVTATDRATDALNRIRDRRGGYERRQPTPTISDDAQADEPDPALVDAYRSIIEQSIAMPA